MFSNVSKAQTGGVEILLESQVGYFTPSNPTMPHHYCPCGTRLKQVAIARSLNSLYLRLFLSIKTEQRVNRDTKVCSSCHATYYVWRRNNPEFDELLSTMEDAALNEDGDDIDSELGIVKNDVSVRGSLMLCSLCLQNESTDTSVVSSSDETNVSATSYDLRSDSGVISLPVNCTISSHQ